MSLFAFAPSRGPRWQIGLQAGLGMAVPIAVMTLLGHPSLGYIAASGAFTVLFTSALPTAERAVTLPFVSLGLILCATLGAAAAPSSALVGAGIVLVAIVTAGLAFGFRLGAPGPLFFVLVFGLSATVVKSAPVPPWAYVLAIAAGCVFSYLVAVSPLLLPFPRARARRLRDLFPGPVWDADARLLVLRVAIVSVVGVLISLLLDPGRGYWIVGAAVAVIGIAATRRAALQRAGHRVLGTIAGAGLYVALALLHPSGIWLALLLGGLQFAIELVVVRHYALALMLITPLVLLLLGAATDSIGDVSVAVERVVDTAAGAALGALSGFLHPRDRARTR